MSRNGSGTYTLPAGNPVVTGTVISSTVHNNTMSDIGDEITNSVDKDGQTVITGDIDYNGNALILDVDGDSKVEVSTDDRFDITLGAVLSLSTTSAQTLLLDALAKLTPADSNIIVGNGTTWVAESGSTARASLGVDLTTKGSILVGNGTVPAALAAGTDGHVLSYDSAEVTGIKGIAIPDTARDYQAITSSGTWTKPADAQFVLVELWSGGGGGASSTSAGTAGGGSGGEYVYRLFQASALGATETVTIGAGGAGGAAGAGNAGSVGGNTTFGSLLTAVGGNPGNTTGRATIPRSSSASDTISNTTFYPLSTFSQAGYGGASGVGGKTIYGGGGGGGNSNAGGTSEYGGNGGAGTDTLNTAGTDGTAPGGGGGGSGTSNASGGGGAGARGECRVWTW